jgi:hypothetical protein
VLATRDGATFSSEILTTTFHEGPSWPRVHGVGGRLWVDWVDSTGEMTWKRQLGGQPWEPTQVESYGTAEERDFHVRGVVRRRALE